MPKKLSPADVADRALDALTPEQEAAVIALAKDVAARCARQHLAVADAWAEVLDCLAAAYTRAPEGNP